MLTKAANQYISRVALTRFMDVYGDDMLKTYKGFRKVRSKVRLVQRAFKAEVPVQATPEPERRPLQKKAASVSYADDLLRGLALYGDDAVILAARYRNQRQPKKKKATTVKMTKHANWLGKGLAKVTSMITGKPGTAAMSKNVGAVARKGAQRTLTPAGTRMANKVNTTARTLNQQTVKPSNFWYNHNTPTGSGGDMFSAVTPRLNRFNSVQATKFASLRACVAGGLGCRPK